MKISEVALSVGGDTYWVWQIGRLRVLVAGRLSYSANWNYFSRFRFSHLPLFLYYFSLRAYYFLSLKYVLVIPLSSICLFRDLFRGVFIVFLFIGNHFFCFINYFTHPLILFLFYFSSSLLSRLVCLFLSRSSSNNKTTTKMITTTLSLWGS
jgi:hypothetical protein